MGPPFTSLSTDEASIKTSRIRSHNALQYDYESDALPQDQPRPTAGLVAHQKGAITNLQACHIL